MENSKTQEEEVGMLRYRIENEGLEYAVRHYSDFKEIKDEEFHRLRQAFVEAANALEAYVGEMDGGEEWEE